MSSNNNNNSKKVCKHDVRAETDLSCTVCGMSRYDQLQNKEQRLTKFRENLREYKNKWKNYENIILLNQISECLL